MEGVVGGHPHASMTVLGGVGHIGCPLRGPPLGYQQVFRGVHTVGEAPRCGERDKSYASNIHELVGQPLPDSLKGGDGATELLSGGGVLGRDGKRSFGHAQLGCADAKPKVV